MRRLFGLNVEAPWRGGGVSVAWTGVPAPEDWRSVPPQTIVTDVFSDGRALAPGSTITDVLAWLAAREIVAEPQDFGWDYEFYLTEYEDFEFRTRWF